MNAFALKATLVVSRVFNPRLVALSLVVLFAAGNAQAGLWADFHGYLQVEGVYDGLFSRFGFLRELFGSSMTIPPGVDASSMTIPPGVNANSMTIPPGFAG